MSDIMLHGVLNMPIDVWGDTTIDKTQRHAVYRRASARIKNSISNAELEKLIVKYEKREKDPQRPPYEQEAYAFAAYDLKQLIGINDE